MTRSEKKRIERSVRAWRGDALAVDDRRKKLLWSLVVATAVTLALVLPAFAGDKGKGHDRDEVQALEEEYTPSDKAMDKLEQAAESRNHKIETIDRLLESGEITQEQYDSRSEQITDHESDRTIQILEKDGMPME